ncbi:PREDICTED: thioredoxin O2, mitochondrial [Theobroma cacao]|uniref:Thioredoxin O2, mitochondrial n=2 Tax=Theobroma cacao TaxID=3641 RepID=A0AB32VJR0_THECC|nr:PREDICTED: thioredoxin O2, mitochondrial [Theobroma cacao]EOY00865.1 Thioredoxin O2, putative isoform 1 [Theobroma cacao]
MRGKSVFRPFLVREAFNFRSISSTSSSFPLNQNYLISTPKTNSSIPSKPSSNSISAKFNLSSPFSNFSRTFCSVPPPQFKEDSLPVPPNVVPIKSEEEFNTALSKAEGESVPAVFYFTAVWCAPCRYISPVMEELARRNPHVTTNKIDIDEEALASTLKKLNITAVPTVHFFIEGKKKDEVVGADITRIVQTMNKLYMKKND